MTRDIVKQLDHSMPAAYNARLGSAIDALQDAVNALLLRPAKFSLGSPAALSTNALISAATSTELPNTETVTYTTATDNVSPLDGAIAAPSSVLMAHDNAIHLVWVLDVPRNVTSVTTHSSAVVAMTILVTGFDQYKQPLSELLTVTAGTTSKAIAGKKAFKYIESIAIAAAADAEANTLNMGFGDVLGLPYKLAAKSDLLQTWFNQIEEATLPTIVVADESAVTTTTGDPRGTVDLNSAMNGSAVAVYMTPGADYVAANGLTALSDL